MPEGYGDAPFIPIDLNRDLYLLSLESGRGRRVSFHEEVNVRVYPSEETVRRPSDTSSITTIDDIDNLTQEVSNRLSTYKVKDAPLPSLEELCDSITSSEEIDRQLTDNPRATTSKTPGSTLQPVDPMQFERDFGEMDVHMRKTYPKYYHFLKSHIIVAEDGSEEHKAQMKEFKEAIVGCRQYPAEYFQDLENTITYYDKMSSGFN